MSNWLFLRGQHDERTEKSIKDDDCMWIQLFAALSENEYAQIWLNKPKQEPLWDYQWTYNESTIILKKEYKPFIHIPKPTHVFARGGFDYYLPILKSCPDAYKIRYGAGRRFMPEPDIDYQLILVDTEAQKRAVLKQYPKANVKLFIKPAALHFKPIECEKEYDICYIANHQQARFKGVKFVYETVPRDLKVLHMGYIDTHITPPPNITRKRVDRIDMPKWISKCKVGIVPYDSVDSCPRVIPEMLACGLPIVCLDAVNYDIEKYRVSLQCHKNGFWEKVKALKGVFKTYGKSSSDYYQKNLSLPVAANYLKGLINE